MFNLFNFMIIFQLLLNNTGLKKIQYLTLRINFKILFQSVLKYFNLFKLHVTMLMLILLLEVILFNPIYIVMNFLLFKITNRNILIHKLNKSPGSGLWQIKSSPLKAILWAINVWKWYETCWSKSENNKWSKLFITIWFWGRNSVTH